MYSCTRYLLASMQRRELMMLACRYYYVHHNNKLHIVRLDYTYMELSSTLRPPRDNDSSVKEHSKYSSRSPQLLRGVNYVGHKTKESGLAQDPRVELLYTEYYLALESYVGRLRFLASRAAQALLLLSSLLHQACHAPLQE